MISKLINFFKPKNIYVIECLTVDYELQKETQEIVGFFIKEKDAIRFCNTTFLQYPLYTGEHTGFQAKYRYREIKSL